MRQRDAFSYGPPGRPRVVLPPAAAVRWRDPGLFDPLVLHELAHVWHRDVALAWLARSVWYALAPLLALPVVVALLSSDRSILFDFLWRAALLALTAALISARLLRSREHDADLRAAQITGDARPVIALLRQVPPQARPGRLRQLLARHPAPSQRILALEQPERVTGLTFLDCFISAFLAALLFPLALNVLVVLFTGAGRTDLGELAAALLAGPLLGGSVGLGYGGQRCCRAPPEPRPGSPRPPPGWPRGWWSGNSHRWGAPAPAACTTPGGWPSRRPWASAPPPCAPGSDSSTPTQSPVSAGVRP